MMSLRLPCPMLLLVIASCVLIARPIDGAFSSPRRRTFSISVAPSSAPSSGTSKNRNNNNNNSQSTPPSRRVWDGFLNGGGGGSDVENTMYNNILSPRRNSKTESVYTIAQFLCAYNDGDVDALLPLLAQDVVLDDYAFFQPCLGRDAVERRLRLQLEPLVRNKRIVVVDDRALGLEAASLQFHVQQDGVAVPNSRGCVFFALDGLGALTRIDWITETAVKRGEADLKLLTLASRVLTPSSGSGKDNDDEEMTAIQKRQKTKNDRTDTRQFLTPPEQYFDAWNRRDMEAAVQVFSETVTYDDTAFSNPFAGREKLRQHLLLCAQAFPETFTFEVDALVQDENRYAVRWHVENGGEPLPFTKGISFYRVVASNDKNNRNSEVIQSGLDFVEGGPFKMGTTKLWLSSLGLKVAQEPVRLVPLVAWLAYMYIVFVSDGILPGANALQLEARTWQEVRDLSLNFFFVAPLLKLSFSPVVHPMLEGVFNLLLSWAAMFAGFLSDDRRDKPNLLPMFPTVVGMQFLTSAFLLPYLATRTSESRRDVVTLEELPYAAQVCESRLLGPAMAVVGGFSFAWAAGGRYSEFGEWNQRWASFGDLMSIDRVGSSFVVDLIIFALFQGWFIDDDLRRRGASRKDTATLSAIGKFIPFFGMAFYLAFRPSFASQEQEEDLLL